MRKILLIFFIGGFLGACNWISSKNGDNKQTSENIEMQLMKENTEKMKRIFFVLPSPIETSLLIKKTGIHFREDLLNSTDNLPSYSTSASRSIALGIYCADLSYAGLNEQYQISMEYINIATNLAESLGVLRTVEPAKIKLLEENLTNKELIVDIISEIYMESSEQLREQDRYTLASLMMISGWIESLYLATQSVKTDEVKHQILIKRVLEQKLSLESIKNVLSENQTDAVIEPIYKDIMELERLFTKSIKSDNENLDFYERYDLIGFEQICLKIKDIRNYMVN